MTDTQLLNFIRQEMKRQGVVWKSERELFEMLIPHEKWANYKTNWSNWKHEKVHDLKKSPHIRLAIGETLFLDPSIWGASALVQKEAVVQGVHKRFVDKASLLSDFTQIIPSFLVDEAQAELLEQLKETSLDEIEKTLKAYPHYFERTFANQDFLLKLLDLLYAQGAYDLLVEQLFPNLLAHHRGKVPIKVMEAHALGSLREPRYMESVKLLESITPSSEKKIIDLKTSMLSNLRRYYLEDKTLPLETLKEGMKSMAKMYYELFVYAKKYHYYPAINLVYILRLLKALKVEMDIKPYDVYKQATLSINDDKASSNLSSRYYASMTELEFLLLLGERGVEKKMDIMLSMQIPSVAWVQRTKRQMNEFVYMVERLGLTLPEEVASFQKVIELLDDYERFR